MDSKQQTAASGSEKDYFARRELRRYAGVWSLWALGIGGVIPGEYSGWSYGLITGGFGGMLIATLVIVVMYLCLCFSLAEMAAAMPFSGGAFAYGRCALGPWGGYLAGVAQNIEYVLAAAAILVAAGDSFDSLISNLFGVHIPDPVIWIAAYLIFTAINIYGIQLTCIIAFILTALALAVLAFFGAVALPHFDMSLALDVPVEQGGTPWLPNGMVSIAWSLPFAIWFLVDIELVTLTPEEAINPQTTIPKGILYGIATLVVAALLVLFLNASIPPGAEAVGKSTQPLMLGLHSVAGWISPAILDVLVLSAYVAGFHAAIYAYGRSIFSISRAGYVLRWLSVTHPARKTPHRALVLGSIVGFAAAMLIREAFPGYHVDDVLLHVAVFSAIFSYIMQMLSFLVLRRQLPELSRPYVSPLGATGAMTAMVIAIVSGGLMFFDPSYRIGLIGAVIIYGVSIVGFVIRGRGRVMDAPEEVFAVAHGR